MIDRTLTVLLISDVGSKDSTLSTILHSKDEQVSLHVRSNLFLPEGPSGHKIVQVSTMDVCDITTRKLKVEGERILEDQRKRMQPRFSNDPPCRSALMAQQELLRLIEANPEGLETMDYIKDFNIRDIDSVDLISRKFYLEGVIDKFVCTNCPKLLEHFSRVRDEILLREQLKHLKFLLSDESLHLIADYHQRIEVLRKLRYIDSSNRVQLKGRVACEMNNHELMITELVFQNLLTDLHHTEIAALLSCFVFQQRRCSEPNLTKTLQEGKDRILSIAGAIAAVQNDCGLVTCEEDFKDQFYFGLVEVVYEWARGVPFSDITNLTDVQEGIIVRCIQRLDEMCRDVRNAARIIGDPTLYKKMEDASESIRRDIVFAASLYTQ
ncbi:hypothetical protein QZH41_015178 [Actinostola sp. cb2023]|nr:hypothetical protein QZH41_015178 [Actinostola sp. cb2023]